MSKRKLSYTLHVWELPDNVSIWFSKNKPVDTFHRDYQKGIRNLSSSGKYKTIERARRTMRYLLDTYPGAIVEIVRWKFEKGRRLMQSHCYCDDRHKLDWFMNEHRR